MSIRPRARPQTWYTLLASGCLAAAGGFLVLAIGGAILAESLATAASLLCAAAFAIPGLYFLGHLRALKARDRALALAAGYVESRGVVDLTDLAAELHVSMSEAEKILRIAMEEGHVSGTFDGRGRFVASHGPRGGRESG